MTATAMTDREPGPGERAARARERYQRNFLIMAAAFGGVIGGALAIATPGKGGFRELAAGQLTMNPVAAVMIATALVIGLVGFPLYGFRKIDEVKVMRNLWSMAAAWFVVIGGYPAWVVLAAGGLLPQPSALALFIGAYAATMLAYVVQRLRDGG